MWPNSEQELGAAVVEHFRTAGHTVYQEVQLEAYGTVADIVVRSSELWVVETKLHFGLDVIAQARDWVGYAHRVFVAVPARVRSRSWDFGVEALRWQGIGLYAAASGSIWPEVPARLDPNPRSLGLFDNLTADHESFAPAGNADGLRLTPYTQTSERLREFVQENPGRTIRECVAAIQHHYRGNRSAENALKKWLTAGRMRGLEARFDGRRYRVYVSKGEDADADTLRTA